MKNDLMELILESYEDGEISGEDALMYANFVEYADLEDIDDIDVLTEMVDMLIDDDVVYEASRANTDNKKLTKEQKRENRKQRIANMKAAVSRNKGKIIAGAGLVAGTTAGYLAGKAGSDRKHGKTIADLNDSLTKKSTDYDKQNVGLNEEIKNLKKKLSDTENQYNLTKRADAYRKALSGSGVADSIKNRAHVNLDDVNKPVTQDQLNGLNRRLNASIDKSKTVGNSNYPERLTTASIAAKSRPIKVTNSRPGSRPGRRPGRR